jgi:metal-dependent hydrolase (beta-lactamase superfamily II)
MISRRRILAASACALFAPFVAKRNEAMAQTPAASITTLFDAFGKPSDLRRGWGYSSLVEYGGRRILFDTGSNAAGFEHNVKLLGVDLKTLHFVVLSHRHNDHTAGLTTCAISAEILRQKTTRIPLGRAPASSRSGKQRKYYRAFISAQRDLRCQARGK